jgi:cytochrome P450
VTATTGDVVYYDPYDFEIDTDPYPVWQRLRDEAPLYYNDRYDFFALSRFADVQRASVEWGAYSSSQGSVLEVIKAGVPIAPGLFIFEDPPLHDAHRGVLSRVFTPRKMVALESQVRDLCARALDPHVGGDGFDFVDVVARDVPMRVIGMLLGIPEGDLGTISSSTQERHHLDEAGPPDVHEMSETSEMFAEYIDWREDHPSDDLMTQMLVTEFEDDTGVRRRLSRTEVLTYTTLLATAGNETTQRLLGWTAKVLGEHPDQRHALAADRALVPNAVEEVLRFESPSPVQARVTTREVELHGQTVPAGSALLLLTASANRDERRFPDADTFDVHRKIDQHVAFGYGLHFCLGAALARMEARIVLDEVLARWTDWEVDHANAVLDHTSTTRGWISLPIRTP